MLVYLHVSIHACVCMYRGSHRTIDLRAGAIALAAGLAANQGVQELNLMNPRLEI